MKYAQFFDTVEFTKAPIVAVQDKNKGFKLVARMSHTEGEEVTQKEIALDSTDGEPRYFKSLSSLPAIFRERELMAFSVELASEEIKKRTRAKTAKPAAKTAPKAANAPKP